MGATSRAARASDRSDRAAAAREDRAFKPRGRSHRARRPHTRRLQRCRPRRTVHQRRGDARRYAFGKTHRRRQMRPLLASAARSAGGRRAVRALRGCRGEAGSGAVTPVWRNRAIGLGLAATIFVLDQWIKALALGPWNLREVGVIDLLPFFDLRWTQNFGVSLGMFEATSPEMRWALVGVTGLIAAVVFVWMLRERAMWDIAGLALILGGAIGNIRDRYLYGYVIDYADFHIGTWRPFLVFNVADAAITIGVVIILARALFMREKPPTAQGDNVADQTAETSTNA